MALSGRANVGTLDASLTARTASDQAAEPFPQSIVARFITAGAHAWSRPANGGLDRMDARSRRKIDMGASALIVSRARPDSDAGYNVSLAQLEAAVARGEKAAAAEREAVVDIRSSSEQKRELRKAMLNGPIDHMAGVGKLAAKEIPELSKSFLTKPGVGSYQVFQAAARTMQAAAEANKEVLARYGMSESVLAQFGQLLNQFDAAVKLGKEGRTAHKGAVLELRSVAVLIGRTVRVMDARNQQRFQDDPQALGAWLSAKRVLGTPSGAGASAPVESGTSSTPVTPAEPGSGTPASGEVRPAA
jgi:hypothetical protein